MILSLLIFAPLIGILFLLCISRKYVFAIKTIGFLATLPSLFITIYVFTKHKMGTDLDFYDYSTKWFKSGDVQSSLGALFRVNYEVSIDGFSLVLLLMTAFITMFAALTAFKITREWKGFYILLLILEIGMLGVFSAANMILFFLFFEMTLISAFFLVGKWGFEQKEKAAYHFLIYNGAGSAILLFVIMVLQARVGTTNIVALTEALSTKGMQFVEPISDNLKFALLIATFVAFGIKLPIFPFHSWMVKMHTQAPIPIVMIHAGILLKIGAYGMIRFGIGLFPEHFVKIAPVIVILGVINFLFGAFMALVQKELKLVLAHSSVSHMGMVLMGFGALNESGIQGAAFQIVSHGLIAALMFMLVGILYHRVHTTEIERLGGLAQIIPRFSGVLMVGALASLGLPGLSGFISEFMVFLGLFDRHRLITAIAAVGIVLTAVYMLRAVLKITYGNTKIPIGEVSILDLSIKEIIPLAILLLPIVVIGVWPNLLRNELHEMIQALMQGLGGYL